MRIGDYLFTGVVGTGLLVVTVVLAVLGLAALLAAAFLWLSRKLKDGVLFGIGACLLVLSAGLAVATLGVAEENADKHDTTAEITAAFEAEGVDVLDVRFDPIYQESQDRNSRLDVAEVEGYEYFAKLRVFTDIIRFKQECQVFEREGAWTTPCFPPGKLAELERFQAYAGNSGVAVTEAHMTDNNFNAVIGVCKLFGAEYKAQGDGTFQMIIIKELTQPPEVGVIDSTPSHQPRMEVEVPFLDADQLFQDPDFAGCKP